MGSSALEFPLLDYPIYASYPQRVLYPRQIPLYASEGPMPAGRARFLMLVDIAPLT